MNPIHEQLRKSFKLMEKGLEEEKIEIIQQSIYGIIESLATNIKNLDDKEIYSALLNLATGFCYLKDYESGTKMIELAINLAPDYYLAYERLADVHEEKGDPVKTGALHAQAKQLRIKT